GVNGSGKSTLLRAALRALTASEGDGRAQVHIRLEHLASLNKGYNPDLDNSFVYDLATAIFRELHMELSSAELDQLGDPRAHDGLTALVEAVLASHAPRLGGADAEAVRSEIARSGLFTLDARSGWWRVWIGCDRTEGVGARLNQSRAR